MEKQSPLMAEQERAQRAKYAELTAHYGNIGPAAILAALACAQRREEQEARIAKIGRRIAA
ncbi:transcriptional regulator [Aquamicrobium sp. cd-1]|uniref:Transcriptional regulator n=2 Tax=Aquamicrobium zhengzhouense TaxID=2781738 RepID=A0ABS0SCN8_9HYPH|nr:transcriptional regulator [Aquamicrobium zhengzhouense]